MKYLKPFEGKPKAIDLCAFAHFPPDVYMQLQNMPFGRSAFVSAGKEALFKRLQRGIENGAFSQPTIDELLALNPDGETDFSLCLQKAFEGDAAAVQSIGELGQWGAFLCGIRPPSDEKRSYAEKYLLALEKLSYAFVTAWQKGDYAGALSMLRESPLAMQIFGEDGISALKPGRTLNAMLCIRAAAAMETYLALMAAFMLESEAIGGDGIRLAKDLRYLLPDPKNPDVTSIQKLTQWLYRNAKVTSWAKLALRIQLSKALAPGSNAAAMLKRWRNGQNIPEMHHFALVCQGAGSSQLKNHRQCHTFAIHLNFLGWFDEVMRKEAQPLMDSHSDLVHPWPKLLHGYTSFEEWAPARFESWYQFHKQRQSL